MNVSNQTTRWALRPKPLPTPRCRLFCFPHAGGAASFFRTWPDGLPDDVELVAIQLPGREQRLTEPPFTAIAEVLPLLVAGIHPLLDRPFAFFGYSLGAFVSLEVARRLRAQHGLDPLHLFVAGQRAPQVPDRETPFCHLPDAEFFDVIRTRYDGLSDEVMRNADLMQFIKIALRADIEMNETYEHRPEQPLGCPITAYHGVEDDSVREDEVASWSVQTTGRFSMQTFPGNHFFVERSRVDMLRAISADLRDSLQPAWPNAETTPASTEHSTRGSHS